MKIKFLILIGALVLTLAGVANAQQNKSTYTIGVSIPAATHGWTGAIDYYAQKSIKRLGQVYPNVHYVLATASNASEQVSDLEDMMATHDIDALVVQPFESDPLTGPVQHIAQTGVFVTVVDRGLAKKGISDLYVAGNNRNFGAVAGRYIAHKLHGKGKIVVLRGLPTVIDNERVKGFKKAIAGTHIKILDMKYADWNQDKGFKIMQDFLQRFSDIDAVWAQDDDTAIGVIAAIKQAGRQKNMFVVGGGGMKQMIKRVMNDSKLVPVDVIYPPTMIATAIDLTTLHHVSNAAIRGRYIFTSPLVTPQNAKQYYHPNSPY
jgi:ribose transport system substrate-binding protein